MSREEFMQELSRCVNGTVMSFNGCDYMKVTETVIENVTMGVTYYRGLDF